jgi:uncharacterized protein (TIGR03437 family)
MYFHALRFGGMLLFAAAIPALAQFSQLAATDDGKQLYFISQLLLKGAAESGVETRLYRYGSDGVTLFAERGSLAPQNASSSSDGVSNPQVSGDGSAIGFTLNDICPSSSGCTQPVSAEGELRGKTTQDLGPGALQLSRNGRWALLTVTNYATPGAAAAITLSSTLIDLSTGQRTTVPSPGLNVTSEPGYRAVASDGTLLAQQNNAVGLWKQGQFTPIQFPIGLALAPIALSDDASTLFLSGAVPGPGGLSAFRILAMNLASGKLTTVFQQKDSTQNPLFMGASGNGQIVLYRYGGIGTLNGPVFVFNATTGASTPIALAAGELATDGTLTGGGDFAFLVTTAGRIVKVTLATGAIDTLLPATPYCDGLSPVVGGSFVRLHCDVTGLVTDLQGHILVNNVPMPILYVTASEIGAQVPWGTEGLLNGNLTLTTANSSPFQASQALDVLDMAPAFEPADPGTSPLLGLKLIKGDWSGLLTSQPAPGDIFYAYMTGLGVVNGPMQTGVAAPLSPPAPILGSLTCQFSQQSSPAKTLFAGLAPGTLGFYQVAFQLPADAGSQPISCASCSWSGARSSGIFSQDCGMIGQIITLQTHSDMMKSLPDDRRRQ